MIFEVIGRPAREEAVRADFEAYIESLVATGVPLVDISFGFAWGNDVYPGQWQIEHLTPSEARIRVREVEEKKIGRIGHDDFFISIPGSGYERLYCHEADIHVISDHEHPALFEAKQLWQKRGWQIFEQKREPNQSPEPMRAKGPHGSS
ncbi:MAG: hypothetical protein H7A44_07910 [Opitutaceae bacterium]|nr:hypothetical protein [Opitutaceae bacterium]